MMVTMTKYLFGAVAVCVISVLMYKNLSKVPEIPRGTVILICGASSGIGEELAYQAAEKGANLVLVARSEDKLLRVQEEALNKGATAVEIISYDFSDVEGSSIVVNKTVERFGKLDYLVLNHAAFPLGPFLANQYMQEPSYIDRIFKVNFFSMIEIALHGLPHLEASSGHLFVTSSTFGEVPINYAMSLYCASKHALNGFFYSLQQELLAKKSPVSLTIGALGLIWTPDMESLWKDDSLPVDFIAGTMELAAKEMLDSYTSRPRTVTYPAFPNNFMRASWYYNPWYQESAVAQGNGYEADLTKWEKKVEVARERRFSQGYSEVSSEQPSV